MKFLLNNQEGLSILEILASILLLSIIIIGFMPLLFHSGNAIEKSGVVIEGTYISQNLIEEVYEVVSSDVGFSDWLDDPETISTQWDYVTSDRDCRMHFQNTSNGIVANMYINAASDEGPSCEALDETAMKNVLITVSTSNKPTIIESQMETILVWEN
ncbi:hypothetical protein [Planococcus sp. MSAK28401]|uniref:hypothetical protein n=1 Tax=Planococcus alpniumensis TaxID=2708345 RepID=UPI001B8B8DA8|nr:hypothetical protein [Planococcus sp. MSAK28401]